MVILQVHHNLMDLNHSEDCIGSGKESNVKWAAMHQIGNTVSRLIEV